MAIHQTAAILIVDDDALVLTALQRGFANEGFRVETASGGASALRRLGNEAFDAVVLDYCLPDMDGLALSKIARDLFDDGTRPRFVAYTATPRRLVGSEAGSDSMFDLIIPKSAGLATIIHAVRQCVAAKRLKQILAA